PMGRALHRLGWFIFLESSARHVHDGRQDVSSWQDVLWGFSEDVGYQHSIASHSCTAARIRPIRRRIVTESLAPRRQKVALVTLPRRWVQQIAGLQQNLWVSSASGS